MELSFDFQKIENRVVEWLVETDGLATFRTGNRFSQLNTELAATMRANVYSVKLSEAESIFSAICSALDICVVDGMSFCQKTDFVQARQIFYTELRKRNYTLRRISDITGRTHSTILRAVADLEDKVYFKDKTILCKIKLVQAEMAALNL